jgi:hypothetical protein
MWFVVPSCPFVCRQGGKGSGEAGASRSQRARVCSRFFCGEIGSVFSNPVCQQRLPIRSCGSAVVVVRTRDDETRTPAKSQCFGGEKVEFDGAGFGFEDGAMLVEDGLAFLSELRAVLPAVAEDGDEAARVEWSLKIAIWYGRSSTSNAERVTCGCGRICAPSADDHRSGAASCGGSGKKLV